MFYNFHCDKNRFVSHSSRPRSAFVACDSYRDTLGYVVSFELERGPGDSLSVWNRYIVTSRTKCYYLFDWSDWWQEPLTTSSSTGRSPQSQPQALALASLIFSSDLDLSSCTVWLDCQPFYDSVSMGSIVWIPIALVAGTLVLYWLSVNLPSLTDPAHAYDR